MCGSIYSNSSFTAQANWTQAQKPAVKLSSLLEHKRLISFNVCVRRFYHFIMQKWMQWARPNSRCSCLLCFVRRLYNECNIHILWMLAGRVDCVIETNQNSWNTCPLWRVLHHATVFVGIAIALVGRCAELLQLSLCHVIICPFGVRLGRPTSLTEIHFKYSIM